MKITRDWLDSQQFEIASRGHELRYDCPNCDDKGKHMYVSSNKSVWYCFKCGTGGKVQNIKQDSNLEFYKSALENKTGPDLPVPKAQFDLYNKLTKQIKSLPLNDSLDTLGINPDKQLYARGYLLQRGVTQREINEYDIRVSLEKSGPYINSIIFPIGRQPSTVNYFVCRKYDNSKPKYVNAPWPKDDALFIADANKGGPNYPWVICEGIFDALAIRRVGYNAIALLGKVPTSQQLKRLCMMERYLIYLDDDAFSQAINLKLQLNAVGTKAQLVIYKIDAAQLYLDDTILLRSLLDGATKQLNEYKK